ncbi:MAG: DUF1553 domain-containing protein [Pirellulales bacterium]
MNVRHYFARKLLCLWLILALACTQDRRVQAVDDINQQARSLLSNRCFACHGPDSAKREGGFRLDDKNSYMSPADSGDAPVIAGKPDKSQLWHRVTTDDVDQRMPPPSFGSALTSKEKELVKQWIEAGAELPPHWSFISPVRPNVPPLESSIPTTQPVVTASWTSPVDRFALQAMKQRGFHPSPEAKRYELLRRVSLDLTGLPPTAVEVAAFEEDHSPMAYERQVDRLLASPAFGENWARKWLDLARYADSAGYADDPDRTIWAYRDWVIRAINQNMPIDQFTIEQLAGDLLPNPTNDQLTATAFHRNTLTNNEGGTNDEEFRNVAIVDRVNTTMAVWMGLTMSCAQCHNHKYDPLSQAEYFKLFAILNQSQDADRRDESPLIELFSDSQLQQLDTWRKRLHEIDSQMSVPSASPELAAWEAKIKQPDWQRLEPTKYSSARQSDATFRDDRSLLVKPVSKLVWAETQAVEFNLPKATQAIQAISIRTVPAASLPGGGAGLGNGNFVLTDVAAELLPKAESVPATKFVRIELKGKEKILSLAEVQIFVGDANVAPKGKATQSSTSYDADASRAIDGNTSGDFDAKSTTHTATEQSPWWEVELAEPSLVSKLTVWNRTDNGLQSRLDGVELICFDANRKETFRHTVKKAKDSQSADVSHSRKIKFVAAYSAYSQSGFEAAKVIDDDAKSGWAVGGQLEKSHLLSLIPDSPIDTTGFDLIKIVLGHNAPYQDHILASYAVELSFESTTRDWVALSDSARKIHEISVKDRTKEQQAELANFFARNFAASTAPLRTEQASLQQQIAKAKPATSVPIMRELAENQQRKTFIQLRGDYKAQGEQVGPGLPAVFHECKIEGPVNRLDLAKWLVDRKNPLTARVWVNRTWESLFGLGIVRTSEEFGTQGDPPTHPELIDWLAVDLMESGWDFKGLLRQLVTSQVYRQTSMVSPELLSQDRDNVWLARGPRVRLSAEMIRDQALASAGVLSSAMFGSPVQPPQPNLGLTAAFGGTTDWTASQGDDRYRRALYTKWRRSAPYPAMATFDAPSREVCILKRDVTNTPLQALVTLNDPVFIEAAQALARRVVLFEKPTESDTVKLDSVFELTTNRRPTDAERAALLELLSGSREHLKTRMPEATKFASDPIGPVPSGSDPVELASWTAVCNVVMNLDEVLMKR